MAVRYLAALMCGTCLPVVAPAAMAQDSHDHHPAPAAHAGPGGDRDARAIASTRLASIVRIFCLKGSDIFK